MTIKLRPLRFPDNFLWGVATAAHQNEGDNTNNDFWHWEHLSGKTADNTTSGLACDWWNPQRKRAEADFDLAADLGLKTLRLSVEWSRIEPKPGQWDEAAIDRYRTMLRALRQRGITPMVTLHHFTNPCWLAERGGWLAPGVVGLFYRYTGYVVQKLGDLCSLWCTINEPMVYAYLAYLEGQWSPGVQNFRKAFRVATVMIKAHLAACYVIHQMNPRDQVGLSKHTPSFKPFLRNSLARSATRLRNTIFNSHFLEAIYHGNLKPPFSLLPRKIPIPASLNDFIGLNYYGQYTIVFNPIAPKTLFGQPIITSNKDMWREPWPDREIYPTGLYEVIERLAMYGKPIYITENGLDDIEDKRRPKFLLTHLAALYRAIQTGIDVRGYYHWTLVDNYEWVEGWTTRFGLIELDPQTQKRTLRSSANLYREIIKANAITPEIVEAYAPEAMEAVFREAGIGH
jgi:beta-glucosidase